TRRRRSKPGLERGANAARRHLRSRAVRERLRGRLRPGDLGVHPDVLGATALLVAAGSAIPLRPVPAVPQVLAAHPAIHDRARRILANRGGCCIDPVRATRDCDPRAPALRRRGHMRYTPVELRHVKVGRTIVGGYSQSETDKLLEDVVASFEEVWRERGEL